MLPAQARLYQETFAQLRSEVAQRHATHAGAILALSFAEA